MPIVETRSGKVESARLNKEMRCTALFGNPVAVEGDPYGEERAAWDGIEAPFGTL